VCVASTRPVFSLRLTATSEELSKQAFNNLFDEQPASGSTKSAAAAAAPPLATADVRSLSLSLSLLDSFALSQLLPVCGARRRPDSQNRPLSHHCDGSSLPEASLVSLSRV
jgi:hypothetical protein